MKDLPITETQIEICDIILRNNNRKISDLTEKYERKDKILSAKYLIDSKLIYEDNFIVLTDLGTRFSSKGIIKFIRHKRNKEIAESPVIKLVMGALTIILSIIFFSMDYNKDNSENKNQGKEFNNNYSPALTRKNVNNIEKDTINKPTKDTTKHIDTKLNVNRKKYD